MSRFVFSNIPNVVRFNSDNVSKRDAINVTYDYDKIIRFSIGQCCWNWEKIKNKTFYPGVHFDAFIVLYARAPTGGVVRYRSRALGCASRVNHKRSRRRPAKLFFGWLHTTARRPFRTNPFAVLDHVIDVTILSYNIPKVYQKLQFFPRVIIII